MYSVQYDMHFQVNPFFHLCLSRGFISMQSKSNKACCGERFERKNQQENLLCGWQSWLSNYPFYFIERKCKRNFRCCFEFRVYFHSAMLWYSFDCCRYHVQMMQNCWFLFSFISLSERKFFNFQRSIHKPFKWNFRSWPCLVKGQKSRWIDTKNEIQCYFCHLLNDT